MPSKPAPLLTSAQVLRHVEDRAGEMERNVFAHPPANWDEFQRRLGQWIELATLANELNNTLKSPENEDDQP